MDLSQIIKLGSDLQILYGYNFFIDFKLGNALEMLKLCCRITLACMYCKKESYCISQTY